MCAARRLQRGAHGILVILDAAVFLAYMDYI
jgi:hypothetical protein